MSLNSTQERISMSTIFKTLPDEKRRVLEQFVTDILNRTETAMTQEHCFLAMELAIKAEKFAKKLDLKL